MKITDATIYFKLLNYHATIIDLISRDVRHVASESYNFIRNYSKFLMQIASSCRSANV